MTLAELRLAFGAPFTVLTATPVGFTVGKNTRVIGTSEPFAVSFHFETPDDARLDVLDRLGATGAKVTVGPDFGMPSPVVDAPKPEKPKSKPPKGK